MSLRLRVVLITAVAVTAMVAVGWLLIIEAVRAEFVDSAAWMSRDRAAEVALLAADGTLAHSLPVLDEGETIVQVVRGHAVVSSTANLAGAPALPLPVQRPGARRNLAVGELPVAGTGPYQVTALGTRSPQGPVTVFVAVSTEDVHDVVEAAIARGTIGLVLLVVPLSALLWFAVGRTLAPVEAVRERAAAITADDLSQRVPEPSRQDEIGRLARTINAMLTRLEDSASEQRRFLADAAHELRSPVASLRTQLETLRSGDLAAEGTEVHDLMTETLRMQALVDQLLTLARSDAGPVGRARVAVDLDDTVGAVVSARRLENQRPEITIDTRDVAPVQVVGDPVLLEQVVRNLVDNAVRYADREVRISLRPRPGVSGPRRRRRRPRHPRGAPHGRVPAFHPAGRRSQPRQRWGGPRPGHRRRRGPLPRGVRGGARRTDGRHPGPGPASRRRPDQPGPGGHAGLVPRGTTAAARPPTGYRVAR